jgi:hypothetical protein
MPSEVNMRKVEQNKWKIFCNDDLHGVYIVALMMCEEMTASCSPQRAKSLVEVLLP